LLAHPLGARASSRARIQGGGDLRGIRVDLQNRVDPGAGAVDGVDACFVVTFEHPNVEAPRGERLAHFYDGGFGGNGVARHGTVDARSGQRRKGRNENAAQPGDPG